MTPLLVERELPTQNNPEYRICDGRFVLVKGDWAASVGHNFGQAFVVMRSEEGVDEAIEKLNGVAYVVLSCFCPRPPT